MKSCESTVAFADRTVHLESRPFQGRLRCPSLPLVERLLLSSAAARNHEEQETEQYVKNGVLS